MRSGGALAFSAPPAASARGVPLWRRSGPCCVERPLLNTACRLSAAMQALLQTITHALPSFITDPARLILGDVRGARRAALLTAALL